MNGLGFPAKAIASYKNKHTLFIYGSGSYAERYISASVFNKPRS